MLFFIEEKIIQRIKNACEWFYENRNIQRSSAKIAANKAHANGLLQYKMRLACFASWFKTSTFTTIVFFSRDFTMIIQNGNFSVRIFLLEIEWWIPMIFYIQLLYRTKNTYIFFHQTFEMITKIGFKFLIISSNFCLMKR